MSELALLLFLLLLDTYYYAIHESKKKLCAFRTIFIVGVYIFDVLQDIVIDVYIYSRSDGII